MRGSWNGSTGWRGTDHTREQVPLLLASRRFGPGAVETRDLGTVQSFACLGQTLAQNFGVGDLGLGHSLLGRLMTQRP